MNYYQAVFNRPFYSSNEDLGQLTYASEHDIKNGTRIKAELGTTLLDAVVVEKVTNSKEVKDMLQRGIKLKHIQHIVDTEPLVNADQIALTKWMASYYLSSWGECIFALLPSARKERSVALSEEIISHFAQEIPSLSKEQMLCVEAILQCAKTLSTNENVPSPSNAIIDMCYVYGVTGSGKTEVFLACISKMMELRRQSIFLVPEIALVLQLYPLFCRRFNNGNVAVLHSKLTKSQRLKEWNRIKRGEAKVILGVRSAVFAPVDNLGLIIIDEEHDQSYKSDSAPRYHARQIAMKRCKQHSAVLVMGSATPSLEAWAYKDSPNMKFLELTSRVAGGAMPIIELISLQHTAGCISVPLQVQIQETLQDNKQVLLLVNRRGFSQTFLCSNCGEIIMCPNCSVNLTYHKGVNAAYCSLQCHHCGYSSAIPNKCPKCDYVSLGVKGWGTQKVEEVISKLFPQTAVARMDSDIIKDHAVGKEILERFYHREVQILVGTQMLAKGLNFPHLRLVGILFADGLLGLPDFRAEERAFALMTQVAGRAGRFFEDGKVVIQAFGIDNNIFKYIRNNDGSRFFNEELERRRRVHLAPARRVLRVVLRGKQEDKVQFIAKAFIDAILAHPHYLHCTIFGPAPCLLARLSNNYRYHILLSAESLKILTVLCADILHGGAKAQASGKKVYIEIDPDPLTIF